MRWQNLCKSLSKSTVSAGFTFLEILISLFLLSIILLGLDAMQVTALHQAKAAYYTSIASRQLFAMREYLLFNPNPDTQYWNMQNKLLLPRGEGFVSADKITIAWGGHEQLCSETKINQSGCVVMVLDA